MTAEEQCVGHVFATPVLQKQWPHTEALNEGLRRIVLEKRGSTDSASHSNVGGWQSAADLLKWDYPEVRTLSEYIHQAFGEVMEAEIGTTAFRCKLTSGCWANVNSDGDYNRIHTHGDCHWSGVYYVDLGEPDPNRVPNGAIEFLDPRGAIAAGKVPGSVAGKTITVHPQPGMMLMFPAWLRHGVLPFFGKGERISIAFNLKIIELKVDKK